MQREQEWPEGSEPPPQKPAEDEGWYFDLPGGAWERQEVKNRELRRRITENIEGQNRELPLEEERPRRGLFGMGKKKSEGDSPAQTAGGTYRLARGGNLEDLADLTGEPTSPTPGAPPPLRLHRDQRAGGPDVDDEWSTEPASPFPASASDETPDAPLSRWDQMFGAPASGGIVEGMRGWARGEAAPPPLEDEPGFEALSEPAPPPSRWDLAFGNDEASEPAPPAQRPPAARKPGEPPAESRWDSMFGASAGEGGSLESMRRWAHGEEEPAPPWASEASPEPPHRIAAETAAESGSPIEAMRHWAHGEPLAPAGESPDPQWTVSSGTGPAPGLMPPPEPVPQAFAMSAPPPDQVAPAPVASQKKPGPLGRLFGRKKHDAPPPGGAQSDYLVGPTGAWLPPDTSNEGDIQVAGEIEAQPVSAWFAPPGLAAGWTPPAEEIAAPEEELEPEPAVAWQMPAESDEELEPEPAAAWQLPAESDEELEPEPATAWQMPAETEVELEPEPAIAWQMPAETEVELEPEPAAAWQMPTGSDEELEPTAWEQPEGGDIEVPSEIGDQPASGWLAPAALEADWVAPEEDESPVAASASVPAPAPWHIAPAASFAPEAEDAADDAAKPLSPPIPFTRQPGFTGFHEPDERAGQSMADVLASFAPSEAGAEPLAVVAPLSPTSDLPEAAAESGWDPEPLEPETSPASQEPADDPWVSFLAARQPEPPAAPAPAVDEAAAPPPAWQPQPPEDAIEPASPAPHDSGDDDDSGWGALVPGGDDEPPQTPTGSFPGPGSPYGATPPATPGAPAPIERGDVARWLDTALDAGQAHDPFDDWRRAAPTPPAETPLVQTPAPRLTAGDWHIDDEDEDVVLKAFEAHANTELDEDHPFGAAGHAPGPVTTFSDLLGHDGDALVAELTEPEVEVRPFSRLQGWAPQRAVPAGPAPAAWPTAPAESAPGAAAEMETAGLGLFAPPTPPAAVASAPAHSRTRTVVREVVETLLLAVLVFLAVRASFQNFKVDGSSMYPTLENGEFLIVNKLVYSEVDLNKLSNFVPFIDPGDDPQRNVFHAPERGDIVVLKDPRDPTQDLIKRVVGKPGETVEIQDGKVYINDRYLEEPYIKSVWHDNKAKLLLGKDEYFVMGDNRENSLDSRSSSIGLIHKDLIIGKAMLSYWPSSKFGLAPNGGGKLAADISTRNGRPVLTAMRIGEPAAH